MFSFDYTEREILFALRTSTRKDSIAALEAVKCPDEPLMAESVERLIQKLSWMKDTEFDAADKQLPE